MTEKYLFFVLYGFCIVENCSAYLENYLWTV